MEYEFEDSKPCINVFGRDHYRKVLMSIVEVYRSGRRGVSFYDLYKKERVLHSANILKRVLDVLISCGYAVHVEGSAETNSPMGRKDYIPTPLGVFVYQLLKLHSFIKDLLSKNAREEDEVKWVKEIEKTQTLQEIRSHIKHFLTTGFDLALCSTLHRFLNTSVPKNLVTGIKAVIHITTPPLLRVIDEPLLIDSVKAQLELRDSHEQEELAMRLHIRNICELQLPIVLRQLQTRERYLVQLGYDNKKCSERGANEDYYCIELAVIEDLKSMYGLLIEMLMVHKEKSLHHKLHHA
jgi:hypothetical protein